MSEVLDSDLTRRSFLRALAVTGAATLASACSQPSPAPPQAPAVKAPAEPPTSAPAAAVSNPAPATAAAPAAATDWDKVVAAAKQEKTLSIATYSGGGHRKFLDAFLEANPGLQVEHSQFQSSSRDFVPRLLQELKAGLHTFDIAIMPVPEMVRQVREAKGLDPIRPILVRPDVTSDASWLDGFEAGFSDTDKKWGYTLCRYFENQFWVNKDLVNPAEFKTIKDLTDPKWKGKIVSGDPRTKGSGFLPATAIRLNSGSDDFMKDFYVDQEVVLSTDYRQMTEFMVRGRYPIGLGAVDQVILADFQSEGLGNNLVRAPIKELLYTNAGNTAMYLITGAPHPNVAQVFANWITSKDGGEAYSKAISYNSRRADVPVIDPDTLPEKGVKYLAVDAEDKLDEVQKTQDIAKALLN
jgi:iron(III) transport system substrate-binding protein